MSTQHRIRLLQMLRETSSKRLEDIDTADQGKQNRIKENPLADPVTSVSECMMNSQPPMPRQQYLRNPTTPRVSQGAATTASHPHTPYNASARPCEDLAAPGHSPQLTNMSRPHPPRGRWGAWGSSVPRPEFDDSKYGKPRVAGSHLAKPSSNFENGVTIQVSADKARTPTHIGEVTSSDLDRSSTQPAVPVKSRTQKVQSICLTAAASPRSTGKLSFRLCRNFSCAEHLVGIPEAGPQSIQTAAVGASRHSEIDGQAAIKPTQDKRVPSPTTLRMQDHTPPSQPPETITAKSPTAQRVEALAAELSRKESKYVTAALDGDQTSFTARAPKDDEQVLNTHKAITISSTFAPSERPLAHAASRSGRPPLEYYQKRMTGQQKSRNSHRQASPTDKVSAADYERAKMEVLAGVERRNNEKRQKKHATADLAMLHALRWPMSAEEERASIAQAQHYQKLGESPANWPKESWDDGGGHASEAFARTREDLRMESQITKAQKQADGWDVPDGAKQMNEERADMPAIKSKRNDRWATASEVEAEVKQVDDNAWGSENPDISGASDDSIQAVNNGSIGEGPDQGLVGWDGKLMQPAADWENRSRCHPRKYFPGHGDFGEFIDQSFYHQLPTFDTIIPTQTLMNMDLHPDGIGMVGREFRVTPGRMVSRFGYSKKVVPDVQELLSDFVPAEFHVEEPVSVQVREEVGYVETSEIYTQRFLLLRGFRSVSGTMQVTTLESEVHHEPLETAPPKTVSKPPILSVYLRPATAADLPQLVNIYNWHIENGPRPTEMRCITEEDMQLRLDEAIENKLPFIVAVEKMKNKKSRKGGTADAHAHRIGGSAYQAIVTEEKIVGWSSAADWSASDYVERTSAEIELYVDPQYRKQGVGRSLMDKMMHICDPAYFYNNACTFHHIPGKEAIYSGGGGRDLHKLWFIIRTWSRPMKTKEADKTKKVSDCEDEVNDWLKACIEAWDFEQEGHLKQVGAKDGR
jgi:L-amino acid N-acyltransferase YncA